MSPIIIPNNIVEKVINLLEDNISELEKDKNKLERVLKEIYDESKSTEIRQKVLDTIGYGAVCPDCEKMLCICAEEE